MWDTIQNQNDAHDRLYRMDHVFVRERLQECQSEMVNFDGRPSTGVEYVVQHLREMRK